MTFWLNVPHPAVYWPQQLSHIIQHICPEEYTKQMSLYVHLIVVAQDIRNIKSNRSNIKLSRSCQGVQDMFYHNRNKMKRMNRETLMKTSQMIAVQEKVVLPELTMSLLLMLEWATGYNCHSAAYLLLNKLYIQHSLWHLYIQITCGGRLHFAYKKWLRLPLKSKPILALTFLNITVYCCVFCVCYV